MKLRVNKPALAALAIGMLVAIQAYAQSSVTFGRITNVQQVQVEDPGARAAGTLVGGALGVASGGSGRSSSNRALRGLGGAAVGSRAAGAMSRSTAFEYTVLIDGTYTIRMVTDAAGRRVGDCVAVERGSFNNLRMAAKSVATRAAAPCLSRRGPSQTPASPPSSSSSTRQPTKTSTAPSAACGCSATTKSMTVSRRGAGL